MTANTNRRPQRASARGVPRRSLFSRAVRVRRDGSPVHDRLRPLQPGRSELREYDLDTYGTFRNRPRDRLQGHEVLQQMWLRLHRGAQRGRSGISAQNPALALPDAVHRRVTELQRLHGLFSEARVRQMSWIQNAAMNLRILRGAGVPPDVVATLGREVQRHARTHGLRGALDLDAVFARPLASR